MDYMSTSDAIIDVPDPLFPEFNRVYATYEPSGSGGAPYVRDRYWRGARTGNSSPQFNEQHFKFNTYSGADITAQFLVPGESRPLVLGDLSTLSYSIHRENTPVRVIGHVNPQGWLRGPRTIAGSLIFTNFDQYTFNRLEKFQQGGLAGFYPLADMLPPFDIVVSFSNEYGNFSKLRIFGVNIVDEGSTMSVDDLVTESTYTFMARGIMPMQADIPVDIFNASMMGAAGYADLPAITFGSV